MKLLTNPSIISIIFLLIFSVFALKSLLTPGFYTSHDGEDHAVRIAQYYQAIRDGQIPPRFAKTLENGLGSPIFVYIYPLPYLLGSAIHFLGINYANTLKILMAASFIFSQLFAFLWLKEATRSEKAAFLGALFYAWVPYRFLLIYVRASLSESVAYTFLPLVFYALEKLNQKNNLKWITILAISYSCLLLSQNLVAAIATPLLALYALILTIMTRSITLLKKSVAGLIWGFLIAQITYLPSLLERNFTHFDAAFRGAYQDHFVTLRQLIYSPWGYGFDVPGAVQISLQIGLAHIAVLALFILSLITILLLKISNKLTKKAPLPQVYDNLEMAIFFGITLVLCILLILHNKVTAEVWQRLKFLQFIDIPWRLLGIVSICLAYLAAFVAKLIKPGIIFMALVVFVLVANRHHLKINLPLDRPDAFFDNYTDSTTQYGEFTPIWRQTTKLPEGFDLLTRAQVTNGHADILNVINKSNSLDFNAIVTSPNTKILINKIYFPKTTILIDSQPVKFTTTDTNSLDLKTQTDNSGLVQLEIPTGNHLISMNYGETTIRLLADYLTIVSITFAFLILIKYAKT